MTKLRCGIEFEYALIDTEGETPGRLRDFANLAFADIAAALARPPGAEDAALATGDLGVKRGYWYPEGDERFHPDGRFRTLEVKGVEIRTPPKTNIPDAIAALREIEGELAQRLAAHGLGLAIAAANPRRDTYCFSPPLNAWEIELRRTHSAYDGAHVSTLSYGPDINLSFPGQTPAAALETTRKLNYYAPWLVPFSFCSPFHAGTRWRGVSWRTFHRAPLRPAVKLYLAAAERARLNSRLVYPARQPSEQGRIEFKAFDAQPSAAVLSALCHLLVGVCLANLPGRSEITEVAPYQRAARFAFHDPDTRRGCRMLLDRARVALAYAGFDENALTPLYYLLATRTTPAHWLTTQWRDGGGMVFAGGLRADEDAFALPVAGCDITPLAI